MWSRKMKEWSVNLVKNVFVLFSRRRDCGRQRWWRCRKSEPSGAILFVHVSLLQNVASHSWRRLVLKSATRMGDKLVEILDHRNFRWLVRTVKPRFYNIDLLLGIFCSQWCKIRWSFSMFCPISCNFDDRFRCFVPPFEPIIENFDDLKFRRTCAAPKAQRGQVKSAFTAGICS